MYVQYFIARTGNSSSVGVPFRPGVYIYFTHIILKYYIELFSFKTLYI